MKYHGIELKEFTSDKPVTFDPPRKMLVWDSDDWNYPETTDVYAFMPAWRYPVATTTHTFVHCAEIPEEPKSRRATEFELAKWLAQGNGCFTNVDGDYAWTCIDYDRTNPGKECNKDWRIRKWDNEEWHEPTADYMGLEG